MHGGINSAQSRGLSICPELLICAMLPASLSLVYVNTVQRTKGAGGIRSSFAKLCHRPLEVSLPIMMVSLQGLLKATSSRVFAGSEDHLIFSGCLVHFGGRFPMRYRTSLSYGEVVWLTPYVSGVHVWISLHGEAVKMRYLTTGLK